MYEYYIKETNQVFYVGKGSEYRYSNTSPCHRSKGFNAIYNKETCAVRIVFNHLAEEDAFRLEKELIAYYRSQPGNILTNIANGGGGHNPHRWDETEKAKMRIAQSGVNNNNYHHFWNDDQRQALSSLVRDTQRYVGGKNPKAKKVQCIETKQTFDTMQEAAWSLGLRHGSSIYHAINRPNGMAGGYHWKIIEV